MKILKKMMQLTRGWISMRSVDGHGKHLRIDGKLRVTNEGCITIGDRFRTRGKVSLNCEQGGTLTIGNNVFINEGSEIATTHCVSIGDNALIGPEVRFMDSDYHDVYDHTKPGKKAPIIVGKNVWIAARAMILKGVTIGDGAVVAAGAIVSKNVPPRAIVAGNPAQVIRRLDESQSERAASR
jgi:acetyltransferase-like isoleucine patch superfamily enzyme